MSKRAEETKRSKGVENQSIIKKGRNERKKRKKNQEVSKYNKKVLGCIICQYAHTLVSCNFQEVLKMLFVILNIRKKEKKKRVKY